MASTWNATRDGVRIVESLARLGGRRERTAANYPVSIPEVNAEVRAARIVFSATLPLARLLAGAEVHLEARGTRTAGVVNLLTRVLASISLRDALGSLDEPLRVAVRSARRLDVWCARDSVIVTIADDRGAETVLIAEDNNSITAAADAAAPVVQPLLMLYVHPGLSSGARDLAESRFDLAH